jgi:N-acetylneuraminic acid mutarotase
MRRLPLLRLPTLLLGLILGCSSESKTEPAAALDAGIAEPVDAAPAVPSDPVGFRSAGKLREPRALATATRLKDGRVLVVGGEGDDYKMMASVEIYDPATETTTAGPPMPAPRSHHTATLLANGQVLVAGGGQGSEISIPNGEGVLASAVLYDPAANAWREAGAMSGKRAGHQAVALADGRVLVVGGGDRVGYPCAAIHPNCNVAESIGTAEIYDPASGTFSRTGDLAFPRVAFSLDVLRSGKVVATGGGAKNAGLTSVEIFDPKAGTWSKGPDLDGQRLFHASAAVDNTLLVVGGKIANVKPISNADLLDEGASKWRRGASVEIPRTGAKLVPLASGRVLLVAGFNQLENSAIADARLYDPATDSWTPIAKLAAERSTHTAVLLEDGSVLVAGGRGVAGFVVSEIERTRSE